MSCPSRHIYMWAVPVHSLCGLSQPIHLCVGCPSLHISMWAVPANMSLCGLSRPTRFYVCPVPADTSICGLFQYTVCGLSQPIHLCVGCPRLHISLWAIPPNTSLCGLSRLNTFLCMACLSQHIYMLAVPPNMSLCVVWLSRCVSA